VSFCLNSLVPPIKPLDTVDAKGADRFHVFRPGITYHHINVTDDWFYHYTKFYNRLQGPGEYPYYITPVSGYIVPVSARIYSKQSFTPTHIP
jgi:hypothetical protein